MKNKKKKILHNGTPGTALITGSAGGLGAAFAKRLAREGYNLILVDNRKEPIINLAQELKNKYQIATDTIIADLSKTTDIARVEKHILESKNLTMLINNAGFGILDGYLATTDIQKQLDMIYVHNIATTRFTVAALPGMIERNQGDIINVASILAYIPLIGNAMYCATKAFLLKFTETLYLEIYDTGLRVQILLPGFIRTGFHEAMGDDMSTGEWDKYPWMSAEEVVKESLDTLLQNKVICIPGKKTRRFLRKIKMIPRQLMYKMSIKQSKKSIEAKMRLKNDT